VRGFLEDSAGRFSRWMRWLSAVALLCGAAGLRGTGTLVAASARSASAGGEVFLGGKYIELGVSAKGSFGTSGSAPTGFFRTSGSTRVGMGSDIDGYGVGTDLRIDYFLPGSPEERWAVGFKESGTVYNGGFSRLADDGGNLSLSGNSVVDESSGSNLKARFIGIVRKGGVNWIKVTQVHSFHESDLTFKTTVTLENVSGSNISDLRFMRSFDPDNTVNFSGGGSYTTTNQVVKTVLSSGYTLVTARNTASDTAYTIAAGKRSLVGFYSVDSRSYGFFGGFSNNDPFSIGGTDPVSSPKLRAKLSKRIRLSKLFLMLEVSLQEPVPRSIYRQFSVKVPYRRRSARYLLRPRLRTRRPERLPSRWATWRRRRLR